MTKKIKKQTPLSVKFKDETKVHPLLRDYFGYSLFKASARLRSLMDQALAKYEMQSHHLGIIKLLQLKGSISQIQIGDELGIDKASMVKLIDQLEKEKYVSRQTDKKDRRIKNIILTNKGIKTIQQCDSVKKNVETQFFSKLASEEVTLLKRLMPLLLP